MRLPIFVAFTGLLSRVSTGMAVISVLSVVNMIVAFGYSVPSLWVPFQIGVLDMPIALIAGYCQRNSVPYSILQLDFKNETSQLMQDHWQPLLRR